MDQQYAIITENDISQWNDKTGVSYHFPSRYRQILQTGTNVIYYKGRIRNRKYSNFRKSPNPHYFGVAKIGDVYFDKFNSSNFYADIIDYIPFATAVPNRDSNGDFFEQIPISKQKNFWRDGVRETNEAVFKQILKYANIELEPVGNIEGTSPSIKLNPSDFPDIASVDTAIVDDIFSLQTNKNKINSSGKAVHRYSKNSKAIGDRAEEIVYNYLKTHLPIEERDSIEWLAKKGEKPGYDIRFFTTHGNEMCIEVKGTTAGGFNSFEITSNEWGAAKKHRKNYHLYLVADCLGYSPKIQIITNPYSKHQNNEWSLEPIAYKVTRIQK